MVDFAHYFFLSIPLFGVVLLGYFIASWRNWRTHWTQHASWLIFSLVIPAMLFLMMSNRGALPAVDARLLIAFFGGCLLVFAIGRFIAARFFKLDGVSQSVFALGGIFSNNVMLGLPLASLTLGSAALPSVALILVFNALTLWTLACISVEWARRGAFSVAGLGKTLLGVLTNPIVAAILLGTGFAAAGWRLSPAASTALGGIGTIAGPGALLVLGMGLKNYRVHQEWQQSIAICFVKLLVQPLVVWVIGLALRLPPMELKVVVLLASVAVGVNVYLMAVQFQRMQGAIATCLLMSTVLAAFTTPLLMTLLT